LAFFSGHGGKPSHCRRSEGLDEARPHEDHQLGLFRIIGLQQQPAAVLIGRIRKGGEVDAIVLARRDLLDGVFQSVVQVEINRFDFQGLPGSPVMSTDRVRTSVALPWMKTDLGDTTMGVFTKLRRSGFLP
jgi:hypothetical protein